MEALFHYLCLIFGLYVIRVSQVFINKKLIELKPARYAHDAI